jgi:hypothetical protein
VAAVTSTSLIGIGLYTHAIGEQHYDQLWQPEVDLGDGHVYLGFRDLMEVRVASAFIERGLSAQKVRRAIELAREMAGEERPLSTAKFRTDGRSVFLQLTKEDGSDAMVDLFRQQHVFREVVEPSLKNIEFVDGIPAKWWPNGKQARIVVDPRRSFGQPVESESNIPIAVLSAAAQAEGQPKLRQRSGRYRRQLCAGPLSSIKLKRSDWRREGPLRQLHVSSPR